MKLPLLIFSLLIYSNSNLYSNYIKPDTYTKDGYCVVSSSLQKSLGLKRFNSSKEFKEHCNGKMIFEYKNSRCKWFTMKDMKFNIYIDDKNKKTEFKIGQRIEVCSNTIIESLE